MSPHLKVGAERGINWGRSAMVEAFTVAGSRGVTLMAAESGVKLDSISACRGPPVASGRAMLGSSLVVVRRSDNWVVSWVWLDTFSVFVQWPRRHGRQLEQLLFAFLQEQFLQLPLALHRQQTGGILQKLGKSSQPQLPSGVQNTEVHSLGVSARTI